jgi:hypothetical protein
LGNDTESTIANKGDISTVEQKLCGSVTEENGSRTHQSPLDPNNSNQWDRKPSAMRVHNCRMWQKIQRRYITITDNTNIIDITPASIAQIVQYQSSLGE